LVIWRNAFVFISVTFLLEKSFDDTCALLLHLDSFHDARFHALAFLETESRRALDCLGDALAIDACRLSSALHFSAKVNGNRLALATT